MDSENVTQTKETTTRVERTEVQQPTVVEKRTTIRETVEPEKRPETITITHTED
jgi:hypothetical protein